MNIRSVLLAGAAGLPAADSACAADLPNAEPVEYMAVCPSYGEGFFYIPGTDTCLQISGKVRADYRVLGDSPEPLGAYTLPLDESADDSGTDVRGVLAADVRSETEFGTLRAYVEFEGRARSGLYSNGQGGHQDLLFGFDAAGPSVEVVSAFVQFGGFTAGHAPSFFDFAEYDSIGHFFSDEDVNTLAYTALFGDIAVTVGIEDKYFRAIPFIPLTPDQSIPNVIAALRIEEAWGSAQLSAAVQDNRVEGFPVDDLGWAVQFGVKVNVPVASEGSYVWAQTAYADGAMSYAGGEELGENLFNLVLGHSIVWVDSLVGINNEFWTMGGGVHIQLSDSLRTSLLGLYGYLEEPASGFETDIISAEANVFWTPVDNLDLGAAFIYTSMDTAGFGIPPDFQFVNSWAGILRVERGF